MGIPFAFRFIVATRRATRPCSAHGRTYADYRTIRTLHNHFHNPPTTAFQPHTNHRKPQSTTVLQPLLNLNHFPTTPQSFSNHIPAARSRQTDDPALGKLGDEILSNHSIPASHRTGETAALPCAEAPDTITLQTVPSRRVGRGTHPISFCLLSLRGVLESRNMVKRASCSFPLPNERTSPFPHPGSQTPILPAAKANPSFNQQSLNPHRRRRGRTRGRRKAQHRPWLSQP